MLNPLQTFIPQDATLFSGTLRENLDPFSAFSQNLPGAILIGFTRRRT